MYRNILFCLLLINLDIKECTLVPMKVVKSPSMSGLNTWLKEGSKKLTPLKPSHPPSKTGILKHLSRLSGRCFEKLQKNYRYRLCPFHNATQQEEVLKWRAYGGVIGVWKEWRMEGNHFEGMVMEGGDKCDNGVERSTFVKLECQTEKEREDEISDVKEEHTCHYSITLRTFLVCDPRSLLVYPTLTRALQTRWDWLETMLRNQELTKKGYEHDLRLIMVRAGYINPNKHIDENTTTPPNNTNFNVNTWFDNLEQMAPVLVEKVTTNNPNSPAIPGDDGLIQESFDNIKFASLEECQMRYDSLQKIKSSN